MTIEEQISASEKSLERVLSFFSRIENRASVLFAINTAMLAFLGTNSPALKYFTEWYMFIVVIPIGLIVGSLWCIYKCHFPKLDGGQSSLLYFREISARTEVKFIGEYKKLSKDGYLEDILSQVWRNSEILKEKFDYLKCAFIFLALAIFPWIISLSVFIWKNQFQNSLLR
jgi:hypothetical protein